MSDIFISYASDDLEQASMLASALEQHGWSVWWDRRIPIGTSFDAVIQHELDSASVVIVVWTARALASRWVRSEAERAARQDKLLPVMLEPDIDLPLGVSLIQAVNLSRWRGEPEHPGLRQLVDQLAAQLDTGVRVEATPQAGRPPVAVWPRPKPKLILAALALAVALGALTLSYLRPSTTSVELEVVTSDLHFVTGGEQELFGLLVLKALDAAGLREVALPRSLDGAPRTIAGGDPRGFTLHLEQVSDATGDGALTLESLPVPAGSAVRLFTVPGQAGLAVSIEQTAPHFQANLQGVVQMRVGDEDVVRADFGPPKPLYLASSTQGLAMHLVPADQQQVLNPAPIELSSLGLFRVEERIVDGASRVQRASTVVSGLIVLSASGERKIALDAHADVRLEVVSGQLEAIEMRPDALHLRVRAIVSGLQICEQRECNDLMPSYLARLVARAFNAPSG